MEMAQDQRQIPFGKSTPIVDHRAGGQGLDPCSEAITRRAKFRIGEVVEGSHAAI
jgi:hypothetical protein